MKTIQSFLYRIISIVFSFEAVFTLFLFAGRFKGDPRFDWLPIDLTLLFLVLSLLSGMYILNKKKFVLNKKNFNFFLIFFLFGTYILLSNSWTLSTVYAKEKTLLFIGFIGWIVFATSNIIATDIKRVQRFFISIVLFGLWMLFESYITMTESTGSFITTFGGNYLGVGRIIGFLCCILVAYLLFGKLSKFKRVLLTLIFLASVYLMFSVGARGPFLALLASFIPVLYYMLHFRKDSVRINGKVNILIGFSALIAAYLFYIFTTDKIPSTIRRLFVIVEQENMGASAGSRFDHYKFGIQLWKEKFMLGHGIGSWPLLNGSIDTTSYPHNIFVEILVELGIIGLLIFVLVHLKVIPLLHKTNRLRNPMSIAITTSLLFFLINALVSGDLNDNRYYFAALGLIPVCHLILLRKTKPSYEIKMKGEKLT